MRRVSRDWLVPVVAGVLVCGLSGCAILKGLTADPEYVVHTPDGKAMKPRAATNEELELKQARLWARVDALESELMRQKQRYAVLEKGLMLGLIPDELRNDAVPAGMAPSTLPTTPEDVVPAKPLPQAKKANAPKVKSEHAVDPIVAAEDDTRAVDAGSRWKQAEEYRAGGQWSRAVMAYSTFLKEHPEHERAPEARFYMALSWSRAGEFSMARDEFQTFLRDHPDESGAGAHPLSGRASLEMAAIDEAMGFRERAVQMYQRVIANHADDDIGSIARDRLANLEKAL